MKHLRMPAMECTAGPTRLYIPSGWLAPVAEILPDAATLRVYTAAIGTEAEALRRFQSVFERGYVDLLRRTLYRRAQDYYALFPETARPIRVGRRTLTTLAGFDPVQAAATFIPFERPGRAGSPWIRETLREMRATVHDTG